MKADRLLETTVLSDPEVEMHLRWGLSCTWVRVATPEKLAPSALWRSQAGGDWLAGGTSGKGSVLLLSFLLICLFVC